MTASCPLDRRRGRWAGTRPIARFSAADRIATSTAFSAVGARVVRFTMSNVHLSAGRPGGLRVKTAKVNTAKDVA